MKEFKDELGISIIKEIRKGAPINIIAESHGLRESTLRAWVEQGLQEADADLDTSLARFAIALRQAELKLINVALSLIRKSSKVIRGAAGSDWRNQAWILEHVYPRHYGSQVIEIQNLYEELRSLKDLIHTTTATKISQKPIVKFVDDDIECKEITQGENGHG